MIDVVDGGSAFSVFSQPIPAYDPYAGLSTYQGWFNGLTFGPGSDVQLVSIDGLRGLPALRNGDEAKVARDGSYPSQSDLDERIFTVTLQPFSPTIPFETVLENIANALQNISDPGLLQPLLLMLPSWTEPRQITCRPTAGGVPIDSDYSFGKAVIPVQFTAADPLIYSSTLHSATVGLPDPAAGLTFPLTFPVTFGQSSGGSTTVTNSGNYPTAPLVTIAGPLQNPTITLASTGEFMSFNITLRTGDRLVIDMAEQLVTLNGTGDRFNTVVTGSSYWTLAPGQDSVSLTSTDATKAAGKITVAWRDAWGWA